MSALRFGCSWLFGLALVLAIGCGGEGMVNPVPGITPEEAGPVDGTDTIVEEVRSELTGGEQRGGWCKAGSGCDDGDPCTLDDFCDEGICVGIEVECDDGLECTEDRCQEGGDCDHQLRPGFCLVDGQCLREGEPHPLSPCLECISAVATDGWSADNGNGCDDGDPCTSGDGCQGGLCVGKPVLCPPETTCASFACEQGSCVKQNKTGPCGEDKCRQWSCEDGQCQPGPSIDCDDGNQCTTGLCDPAAGCLHVAAEGSCNDGNDCTVGDHCAAGKCQPGTGKPPCDDGNPCTDDSCHPLLGCMFFPNVAPCDDGNPCFGGDWCMGGQCQSGMEPLECDDGNLCTDDFCEPFIGCLTGANQLACDDGDPCFANDQCGGGLCLPGPVPLACDDGNGCTGDSCEPFAGCLHQPLSGQCNDGSACTANDQCLEGQCTGTKIVCEDGNPCTTDTCSPASGCLFTPIKSKECRPQIIFTHPLRGATLQGSPAITVTGSVTSKAGPITSFLVNGQQVVVGADGSFQQAMTAGQGMNLIVAEAVDGLGNSTRTTPSFYFSTTWYAVDAANPKQSMVTDGLMVFLGPEVWDDDDTSDVDDLATIMTLYLKSMDLGKMISNPVTTGKLGWCNYQVNVSKITYGQPSVDLTPINGGLHMLVTIPNFKADIAIPMSGFLCASMSGTATATAITIDAAVLIAMANGELTATMQQATVTVHNLDIKIDGIMGFLLNWLINFFEGQFADQLEAEFEKQLGALIPATIVDALNSLALDQSLTVNPFLGDGEPLQMQLKTGLSSVAFTPAGGSLGMAATVVAPKGTGHSPLGSIGRAACLSGKPELFAFPMLGQLELALHDDFFNQIPYGMYWGGLFKMAVDPAALGADLSQYGLTEVDLLVDFLLPPILTTCTPDKVEVLQIGDIRIDGTMMMAGLPVTVVVFASLEVEASIVAADTPTGKEISVALGQSRLMEVEVADATGPLAGAEEALVALIEENLVGGLLDSFSAGALGSFPVPDIDLSGFDPSIPPGSTISLDLKQVFRSLGYTVLTGDVK